MATVDDVMRAVDLALTTPTRARMVAGGWSDGTRASYLAEWVKAKAWRHAERVEAVAAWEGAGRTTELGDKIAGSGGIPWSSEVLALYAAHLAERGLAPQTISKAMAGIKAWHRLHGAPVPDGVPAWGVLRRHHRSLKKSGWKPKRAVALRLDDVARILATLDRTTPQGMRDAALVFTGFAGMFRASELVAIRLRDLPEHAEGLALYVPMSKTDQDAAGATVPIVHWAASDGTHHPAFCPVEAVLAWAAYLIGRGAPRSSTLMRPVDQHGNVAGLDEAYAGKVPADGALTQRGLGKAFAALVTGAALPHAERYTLHSLRVGGATEARLRGATLEQIADQGRWSRQSTVILTYIREAEQWINNAMSAVGAYAVSDRLAGYLAALPTSGADDDDV